MYGIEQRTAPVLSTSFGRCEEWFTAADASFFEGYGATAALEGYDRGRGRRGYRGRWMR